jgi:CDP-diglyceride synthetase
MTRRLIFGPILIAGLLGLLWLDDRLAGAVLPGWLAWLGMGTGRWLSGTLLMGLGVVACFRGGWELARIFRAAGIHASKRGLGFSAAGGVLAGALTIGAEAPRLWAGLAQQIGLPGLSATTVLATACALVVFLSMAAYVRHHEHHELDNLQSGDGVRGSGAPRAPDTSGATGAGDGARPYARLHGAAGAVGAAVFAFVYCGVVLGFLMALVREWNVWVVLAVVLVVKACDSGAYFTGTFTRPERRRRLIPWISPGKTWQGLIGGLITAAIFGMGFVALEHWLVPGGAGVAAAGAAGGAADGVAGAVTHRHVGLTLIDGAVLGMLLGLVGQAGDLSASVLKRDAQVKDAGRILPGFGGVIDMFDSLLIAAPVAYWYLLVRASGG